MSNQDAGASHERAAAIRDEHARLRTLLDRVRAETDLRQLVPLLGQLRRQLEEHFATEEAPDGFPAAVRSQPRFASLLDEVMEEHRQFLRQLDDIQESVRRCVEDGDRAHAAAVALAAELHEHEIKENELLIDIAYTDLGEAD
jgi:iron-sulfur cluster repair protein YtfE (RIC family)